MFVENDLVDNLSRRPRRRCENATQLASEAHLTTHDCRNRNPPFLRKKPREVNAFFRRIAVRKSDHTHSQRACIQGLLIGKLWSRREMAAAIVSEAPHT